MSWAAAGVHLTQIAFLFVDGELGYAIVGTCTHDRFDEFDPVENPDLACERHRQIQTSRVHRMVVAPAILEILRTPDDDVVPDGRA